VTLRHSSWEALLPRLHYQDPIWFQSSTFTSAGSHLLGSAALLQLQLFLFLINLLVCALSMSPELFLSPVKTRAPRVASLYPTTD
jgi:hypothetical protein